MKSRLAMWIAYKLPKWIVFWCGMRLMAYATSGQWSNTYPPGLSVMDALERWGQPFLEDEIDNQLIPVGDNNG